MQHFRKECYNVSNQLVTSVSYLHTQSLIGCLLHALIIMYSWWTQCGESWVVCLSSRSAHVIYYCVCLCVQPHPSDPMEEGGWWSAGPSPQHQYVRKSSSSLPHPVRGRGFIWVWGRQLQRQRQTQSASVCGGWESHDLMNTPQWDITEKSYTILILEDTVHTKTSIKMLVSLYFDGHVNTLSWL